MAGQAVSGICWCFIVTRQVFSKRWFVGQLPHTLQEGVQRAALLGLFELAVLGLQDRDLLGDLAHLGRHLDAHHAVVRLAGGVVSLGHGHLH